METKNNTLYSSEHSPVLDDMELRLVAKRESLTISFLRSLAYEAQGFRVLLLLVLFVAVLSLFNSQLPNLVQTAPSIQVMAFSLICSCIIFADRCLFCRARSFSKEALLAGFSGNYEDSKRLFREAMRGLIPPPRDLYFLSLGEAMALSGDIHLADRYIAEGMNYGASRRISIFYALRSRLFSNRLSEEDLEFIGDEVSRDPILEVEMCWIHLVKAEYAKANLLSKKIIEQTSVLHPSGIETREMALIVRALTNLFLGRSEEALTDLEFATKILKGELNAMPTLVPYISLVFLVRSKFYSRMHKTDQEKRADQYRALALCRYPLHSHLAEIKV
jgi:hypothetical protein